MPELVRHPYVYELATISEVMRNYLSWRNKEYGNLSFAPQGTTSFCCFATTPRSFLIPAKGISELFVLFSM